MSDRIVLAGLRGRGHHGVLPQERRDGQTFVADVVLHTSTAGAAASDDLADTVDYASVAAAVVSVIEGPPVDLIETLAERVAAVCLEWVDRVEVTIHKPQAPVGVPFDDVSVSIERSR